MKAMTKLAPLVEIVCNDDDCVLMHVKPMNELALLEIPGFNGEERYIRMSKGASNSYLIKYANGGSVSFSPGELLCQELVDKRKVIHDTIVYSFGIVMDSSVHDQYNTNYIRELGDDAKRVHTYTISGFGRADMSFRKNDGFLGLVSYDDAMEYLAEHFNGMISGPVHTKAPNGCDIYTIVNVVE